MVQEIQQYVKYLGLPSFVGRKKGNLPLHKGANLVKITRMRREAFVTSWERSPNQIYCPSNPHLYNELLQALPIGLCQEIEVLIRKFW